MNKSNLFLTAILVLISIALTINIVLDITDNRKLYTYIDEHDTLTVSKEAYDQASILLDDIVTKQGGGTNNTLFYNIVATSSERYLIAYAYIRVSDGVAECCYMIDLQENVAVYKSYTLLPYGKTP